MPRPVEMTESRAIKAVAVLRDALSALDRGEIDIGALEIIVRNEVWPVELDEEDMAWAMNEASALGLVKG